MSKKRERQKVIEYFLERGGGGSNLTLFFAAASSRKERGESSENELPFHTKKLRVSKTGSSPTFHPPRRFLGKICTKNPLSLSLISPKNFCGGISLPRRGRKRGGKERKKVESNPGSPGDMRKDKVVKKVGTLAQFLIPSPLAGGGGRRPNEDLESDRDSFLSFLPPLSLFRLRQN